VNLAILDTCLNDPLQIGAAMMPAAPEQTLVAYATAAGAFAADGARHGMFTAALLREMMRAPDRQFEEIIERAGLAVRQATGGRQTPWISSAASPLFRWTTAARLDALALPGLVPDVPEPVLALNSRGVLPKDSAEQVELSFWESIKDSTHISDYEAYLQAYPNGRFVGLAKARIERLRTAAPKTTTPPEQPAAKTPPAEPAAKPAPTPKVQEQARPAPAPKPPAEKPADRPPEQARPAAPAPKLEKQSGTQAVSEVQDCPTCPVLIAVPRGAFTMGSNSGDPSEKPAHQVSISTPFAIGKYEVTVEQWNACVAAGACQPVSSASDGAKNMPVRDVSWDDTQQFVKWLSKVSGKPYRLPTEAEWEYAARGGSTTRFWWGEQMRTGAANCKDCGEPWNKDGPAPVGSFAANPYGLYDMNGSVWEWVGDCWHNTFKGAPSDSAVWDDANCRVRVIRGGSWREGASYMPTTTRFKYDASVRHSQNGFRVARDNK
jgi:formylglycine-generating enzyme required for sulfatase activity